MQYYGIKAYVAQLFITLLDGIFTNTDFFLPFRYSMKPRMMIHKSQNLTIAFKFMTATEKIPLVNIGKLPDS